MVFFFFFFFSLPKSRDIFIGPSFFTSSSSYFFSISSLDMAFTIAQLKSKLTLPVFASPMFIVSGPELVIEQCKAGVVGSFPALNARPPHLLDEWLTRIKRELAEYQQANPGRKVAPFAVNQIVHHSNTRLEEDVQMCVKHKVPVIITSLNSPKTVVDAVHTYGGLVFHDVTNVKHAKNALNAGVDGLILVCAVWFPLSLKLLGL